MNAIAGKTMNKTHLFCEHEYIFYKKPSVEAFRSWMNECQYRFNVEPSQFLELQHKKKL